MPRTTPSRIAALFASLGLAMAGGVVSAGPAVANEESGHQIDGAADSARTDIVVVDHGEPITVADLRDLVVQFEATGEVTHAGAQRMEVALVLTERSIARPALAIHGLEMFKSVASDPHYAPGAAARDELNTAADELIAQLS